MSVGILTSQNGILLKMDIKSKFETPIVNIFSMVHSSVDISLTAAASWMSYSARSVLYLFISFSLHCLQDIDLGDSPVLCIQMVEDKVWVGFQIGYLCVYDANSHQSLVQSWVRQGVPILSLASLPCMGKMFCWTRGRLSVLLQ